MPATENQSSHAPRIELHGIRCDGTLASMSYCSVKLGAENCLLPPGRPLSDAAAAVTSLVRARMPRA